MIPANRAAPLRLNGHMEVVATEEAYNFGEPSAIIMRLHGNLTNHLPVALVDAAEDLELISLAVHFEQVDSIDPLTLEECRERRECDGHSRVRIRIFFCISARIGSSGSGGVYSSSDERVSSEMSERGRGLCDVRLEPPPLHPPLVQVASRLARRVREHVKR